MYEKAVGAAETARVHEIIDKLDELEKIVATVRGVLGRQGPA